MVDKIECGLDKCIAATTTPMALSMNSLHTPGAILKSHDVIF